MTDVSPIARAIVSECACMRLRKTARAMTRMYDESLRPAGLQVSQLTLLVALATQGPGGVKLGGLARALVMDRTTLTRNLRPLEKAGWVKTARSPEDARVRVLLLTPEGGKRIEAAFPLWKRAQEQVRTRMGDRPLGILGGHLGLLLEALPRGEPATARDSVRKRGPSKPAAKRRRVPAR